MTIVGCELYDDQQRYLGSFSSHAAAFEVMNRLRDDNYRPLGVTTHLTPLDVRTLARVRREKTA